MRPEGDGRVGDTLTSALAAKLRIHKVPGVASWPAGIGAVDHLVDGLRRQVVAEPVASHVGGPCPTGRRIDPHAHRVPEPTHVDPARATFRRHKVHRCPARIALDTDVAGRPGRQEQLAVGQHGDRPGGVPAGGQALQDDGSIVLVQVGVQAEAKEPGLAGHQQPAVGFEGDRMRGLEAAPDLDRLVGPTVRIAVGQGDDAVGASLCDEQHPVRRDVHEPRRGEARGKDRHLVFVGNNELGEAARSDVDAYAHRPLRDGTQDDDEDDRDKRRDDREQGEIADRLVR